MEVNIQSIHFDADDKLLDFINKKLQKIEQVYPKTLEAQVFLKLDASSGGIHQKIAEIKLHLPGKILFSEEASSSFEESMEAATDNVLSQLIKHKEKLQS